MGRPFDKHIDNKELNALVPSSSETGQEVHGLSPDAVRLRISAAARWICSSRLNTVVGISCMMGMSASLEPLERLQEDDSLVL